MHFEFNPNTQENFFTAHNPNVTKKLWGTEDLIVNTPEYCVKFMTLYNEDAMVSLHFHKKKKETFTLCSGTLIVETVNMGTGVTSVTCLELPGDSITLHPGTPHTFYAPSDQEGYTTFIESSTEDFADDSYRLTRSQGPTTSNR